MSNRHSYNLFAHRYTFDDVALYDYPRGARVSASTSATAACTSSPLPGLRDVHDEPVRQAVTDITSVIANSVGLTPRVPLWSRGKLASPRPWSSACSACPTSTRAGQRRPGLTRGKLFSKAVSLLPSRVRRPGLPHAQPDVGHRLAGALRATRTSHDVTHRRGGDLYGATSMNYYRHVLKMLRRAAAVKYEPSDPGTPAARRLLRPTRGDRDAGPAHHRRGQQGLRGLQHRVPPRLERLRPAAPPVGRLPRIRPPGRVHGHAQRPRHLFLGWWSSSTRTAVAGDRPRRVA